MSENREHGGRGRQYSWKDVERVWTDALDRMVETSSRVSQLLDLTSSGDTQKVEEYLREHDSVLTPEEKFFLQMSLESKKFKGEV